MQPQQVNQPMGVPQQPRPVQPSGAKGNGSKGGGLKKWLKWVVIALVIGLLGFFAWQYTELRAENQKLADPEAAAEEQTQKLLAEVGQLIELPAKETPTIATVKDKEKLKDQPFFEKAENGDKVLIYTTARKAILYRPSTKKIIEVAPINIGNGTQSTTEQTEASTSSDEAQEDASSDTSDTTNDDSSTQE